MATEAVVVTGTIPNTLSSTVDLTSSGFGTPTAAIIFYSNAHSTGNPVDGLVVGMGIWDGTNDEAVGISSQDAKETTNTARAQYNDGVVVPEYSGASNYVRASVSNITDGIRLTVTQDNTSFARFASAILIKGTTNASVVQKQLTVNGANTVTVGHTTHALFAITIGFSSDAATGVGAILSFGAAHNGTSVTQRSISMWTDDAEGTSNADTRLSTANVTGQLFNDAYTWGGSAGSFTSTQFTLTTSASPGNDYVYFLALELPDADDFWLDTLTSPTSTGNDATTGVGFQPEALCAIMTQATAENSITAGIQFSAGCADGTTTRAFEYYDEDGLGTSDTYSEKFDNRLISVSDTDKNDDVVATLSSMDSDGFTLNYSTIDTSGHKGFAFAFGDSTAAGTNITVPQANLTLSASAPSVAVSDNKNIQPDHADLTLSATAPTVTVTTGQDVDITVPQGDLTLSTTAPGVGVSDNIDIEIPQADLVLSATAPDVTVSLGDSPNFIVPQANLSLATTAPSVVATDNQDIEVPQANLSLTGFAPTVDVAANVDITVPQADLVLSTTAPSVDLTTGTNITVPQGDLVLTGFAPSIIATGIGVSVQPGAANLTLTGYAPTVAVGPLRWTPVPDFSTTWTKVEVE